MRVVGDVVRIVEIDETETVNRQVDQQRGQEEPKTNGDYGRALRR